MPKAWHKYFALILLLPLLAFANNFDSEFESAAAEFNIPVELLKAISFINTRMQARQGLSHHGHSKHEFQEKLEELEIEGSPDYFGLMGLSDAQMAKAAEFLHISVESVKDNNLESIRAAAVLLADLVEQQYGDQSLTLGDYHPIVAQFIGYGDAALELQYANEVFTVLKRGVKLGAFYGLAPVSDYLLEPVDYQRLLPSVPVESTPKIYHNIALPSAIDSNVADNYVQSSHYSSRSGTKIKRIVLHTCEGSGSGCVNHLKHNDYSVSAHYVVLESGKITQMVEEKYKAHHVRCCNSDSIGIEHGGYAHSNTWTEAQLQASFALICDIVKRNKLSVSRSVIQSHAELDPSRRTDPGPYYPWDRMISEVSACVSGTPAKKPDLRIDQFSWTPSSPKVGDNVTFHAVVRNDFAETGANVGIAFYVNNQQVGWDATTPIRANSSYSFSMQQTWQVPQDGAFNVKALVDDLNIVAESNESNNTRTATLTVSRDSNSGGGDNNSGSGDSGGDSCASEELTYNLNGGNQMRQSLRAFRDEELKQSEYGQRLTELYYKHTQEVKALIKKDPILRMMGLRLLFRVIYAFNPRQIDNDVIPLDAGYTKLTIAFLNRVQQKGSDALQQDFEELKDLVYELEGLTASALLDAIRVEAE